MESTFAATIRERMRELTISITTLAQTIDSAKKVPPTNSNLRRPISYEHTRKLVNGQALPSMYVLQVIAKELQFPVAELEKLVVEDRMRRRFGDVPSHMVSQSPKFAELNTLLPDITDTQYHTLLDLAGVMARRNRLQARDNHIEELRRDCS